MTQVNTVRVRVTNEQHNKDVTFKFPVGTQIKVDNSVFTVKTDGVYQGNTRKNHLELPAFAIAGLEGCDVNGDSTINRSDINTYNAQGPNASLATRINRKLPGSSPLWVRDLKDESGRITDASAFGNSMGALFSNSRQGNRITNSLNITFK